jgi:dipeptidyl aminopeptidase/acylaminoacyl peptidase
MRLITTALLFLSVQLFAQKNASVSFEKWLSLKDVNSPLIAPDGKTIVYSVNATDWTNNNYDRELWMVREGESPVQLTRTAKGSSYGARFTPDSKFVAFMADRGDKTQIYIISVSGGEALQVTKDEEGINSFEFSPDGSHIAYTRMNADSKIEKTTKERFGAFGVEGEDYKQRHLWLLKFDYDSIVLAGQIPCYDIKKDSTKKDPTPAVKNPDCVQLPVAQRLTDGNFTVGGFDWSPDGKQIIFTRLDNPSILGAITSDIVLINIATKKMDTLVKNPKADFFHKWSPDGKHFVYESTVDDSTSFFYKNNRLFIFDMFTRTSREIAADADMNKIVVDWNKQGLFLAGLQKTKVKLFTTDIKTGKVRALDIPLDLVMGIDFSKNTDKVVVSGRNYAGLNEIYTCKYYQPLKKITNSSAQIAGWNTPVNEIIQWRSQDSTIIEGILLKPKNYDARKKYPLLVVIHGGPTGIDIPDPVGNYVYPLMQWVEKGCLVLRVNYRGSVGYGEKFRSLNVRNLGVGDMWDVMSGVQYLNSKGMIDTTRMGCMGWSQGGYISAFLTTNTNIFKAISVGAGPTNWVTYYANTDITPFTRQYLKATPWEDMDIYRKTSPITNINNATTPTLIQHGEFDKRVPIPNAYELYRGLQDRHIPSKLIIYKGFGHEISKPKERLAAIWHNWQWFNKYVFGEPEENLPTE